MTGRTLWLFMLVLAGPLRWAHAVDPLVLEEEDRRIAVIAKISEPTVAIFANGGEGGGSGVLIRPNGLTVTNFHVVGELGPFMKCGLNDGKVYDAVLVGLDPTGDVALIKLLGRDDFPAAQIGNSDDVRLGDWVYAVGNPFLLADDFQPTVTYGIASGVHRYQEPAGTFLEYADCIQVDASINPGNSGGPLFNATGELIGINGRASFEKKGRVNIGAGYAISVNQVMNFLDHLRSGRMVDHATLGATVRSEADGSVVVDQILESSDAFRRGLRQGDQIVSFSGRPIRSVNQFKNILGIYPNGWRRSLVVNRGGEKISLMVRLRPLHSRAELNPGKNPLIPPQERPGKDGPKQPDEGPRRPRTPPEDGHPFEIPDLGAPPPQVPEEHRHLFVEREGFVNDYFNKLERDRLLQTIESLGSFPEGTWNLEGVTADNRRFEIKLSDTAAALILGDEPFYQSLEALPDGQPPGTGGLLLAMSHLRQLLLAPDDRFTEFYYLGSEPLDGSGPRVDVLITTRGTVTTRWYFDRPDGNLIGFDTQREEDTDPCEIRILRWQEIDGRKWPGEFTVGHGETIWNTLKLSATRFEGPRS